MQLTPLVLALLAAAPLARAGAQDTEQWRCTLAVGDAETAADLPFELSIEGDRAFIVNGAERLPVAEFERTDERLVLGFPHFDSKIEATRDADGAYVGTWRKRRRGSDVAEVPFRATEGHPWRFEPLNGLSVMADAIAGRWRVDFESDDSDAVGLFAADGSSGLTGTFLTRTGDYRFLAGDVGRSTLRLSCFDGAHAFLFEARLEEPGRLAGSFRSGNWWHETWTAVRDDEVALPDPFEELELRKTATVDEALVLLPDGTERTLGAVLAPPGAPAPRATLVQILGTWCPNCFDETEYLKELHARFADRGLAIVGVCFELSGDIDRDLGQIARFRDVRSVPYPLVFGGEADKPAAAAALGLVDRVLSFPTTIFVDSAGRARAVHSGFAGPATGEAHDRLRSEFEELIEGLLAEPPLTDAYWRALTTEPWFDWSADTGATWTFRTNAAGEREVHEHVHGSGVYTLREEVHPVRLAGTTVFIGDEPWIFESLAGVVRRAGWPRQRMTTADIAPLFDEGLTPSDLAQRLESEDALQRREALMALAYRARYSSAVELPDVSPWLADPDPAVRRFAAAVAGWSRQRSAIDALTAALDAPDPRLRALAARSLTLIGELPEDPTARLAELAADDPFPSVRAAAGGS